MMGLHKTTHFEMESDVRSISSQNAVGSTSANLCYYFKKIAVPPHVLNVQITQELTYFE